MPLASRRGVDSAALDCMPRAESQPLDASLPVTTTPAPAAAAMPASDESSTSEVDPAALVKNGS